MLILLWNPAVTIFSMLTAQFGGNNVLRELMMEFGMNNQFIINNWFPLSIVIQLATAGVLLIMAAKRLNPLNHKRKRNHKA